MISAWLAARDLQPRHLEGPALLALLPQRPPLLLVTRVVAMRERPTVALAAELDITGDEPVLAGHFPGRPLWPGCYTLEGLAQTCALAGAVAAPAGATKAPRVMLAAIKLKLKAPVAAPARLEYFAERIAGVDDVHRFAVHASVAGREVASGTLDVAIQEAGP